MKFISSLLLALALPVMAFAQVPADTITVFMIGDSTMANKPLDKENQERGWGQMLPIYLEGAIKVDNHAVNGRSSKSFIDEGRWEKVREQIRPGDYVIIQFGHNDEKAKSPDRYTVPGSTFDANLKKFVNETREKGGTPILMNSIVRRNFPANGIAAAQTDDRQKTWKKGLENYPAEGDTLVDTHGDYRIAPKNVAEEMGVVFVDMNTLTHELVQGLGKDSSKDLFMWMPVGKYEFAPNGRIDNTHLNVYGGIVVSRLAVNALAEKVPALKPYIRRTVYNLNK
ncbi:MULTISPECIES: rhamnogalacturonan acetylesterase [Duncaniella]|jgi:pectinesterase|uniref:rhamnogalacturonan acetylesterase n=1 Tax=Duncaniella TaxID=2518495 RepID=UPI000E834DA6|nr:MULTISPECIES: rhamnogalacturonan acetylesterase [Duncaniella]MBJ2190492.1 rhamnogalacturonan acetylesterase [Muribaculaceae bacterium]MCX4283105.1 rhamnogalacturonan acetylesterase [Duncaniella dubosii]MDE5666485.1 rhamnogalacturonan acetylesterase [Duncaniella sp.]HBN62390.1 lipase [Porphyromonadaceae bacterium]